MDKDFLGISTYVFILTLIYEFILALFSQKNTIKMIHMYNNNELIDHFVVKKMNIDENVTT